MCACVCVRDTAEEQKRLPLSPLLRGDVIIGVFVSSVVFYVFTVPTPTSRGFITLIVETLSNRVKSLLHFFLIIVLFVLFFYV